MEIDKRREDTIGMQLYEPGGTVTQKYGLLARSAVLKGGKGK